MKELSFRSLSKVQGGGILSYFYDWGYQRRLEMSDADIGLNLVYVGSPEALIVFHEKIRQMKQDDTLHQSQLAVLRAQRRSAYQEELYYRDLRAGLSSSVDSISQRADI